MKRSCNPLKFIIVGTGRFGTNLFQNMLKGAGINCGHEDIFYSPNEDETKCNFINNHVYVVESSWASAPYLDKGWIDDDVKIVHLVRDPFSVIKSFTEINFLFQ